MRVTRFLVVSLAASALALLPRAAAGQDAPPKLTVAAAAGIATPFHSDFDFTAPNWELSLRGSVAKHAAVEGFFEQWEHETVNGPQRTNYRMRTMGFNFLATGGSARVSVFGGGGIGLLGYERRSSNFTFTNEGFTVQGVGELDVTVAGPVQVFGRYMMVVPIRDPGFGHGSLVGGVRIRLR